MMVQEQIRMQGQGAAGGFCLKRNGDPQREHRGRMIGSTEPERKISRKGGGNGSRSGSFLGGLLPKERIMTAKAKTKTDKKPKQENSGKDKQTPLDREL